jgi:thioredoxin-like negative regulator of GroEL
MKKRILVVALLLMVGGAVALWVYGRPAYHHYKEKRTLAEAKAFMAKADYREASLSARTALMLNSNNLDACFVMAELSEMAHSPALLDWRRRIADLAPNLTNRLLLASTCLRVQGKPYSIAAQTVEDLANSAQDSAAYHVVAAELALKLGNPSEAAAQFEAAARIEPTNQLHQVNLAVLRLQSTNNAAAVEARATLERLTTSPEVGTVALRWLIGDCIQRADLTGADRFSRQVLANPHAELADRLEHLGILRLERSPEFNAYLDSVQHDSVTNAAAVYSTASWMLGHGMVEGAQQWLTNCSAKVRAQQPVPLALVDCYFARRDWTGLETFLADQKWQDLDFLRFAFLSQAAAKQQQELAADSRWHSAVREAGDQLGALTSLLSLARNWGRPKAEEDLLWQIGQHFPRERWALRDLQRMYVTAGNTRGLNKVFATMANYDSTNFQLQNNVAATSLLLKLNLSQAHEMAKELYASHPEDGIIASTYAYSLHLQGRTKEGVAVMEKLKPETLEQPPVALYYGLLISAAGEPAKAGKYLVLAQKAELLPEEKSLLAEAVRHGG